MSEVRSVQGLRLLALALAITTWYFVRLAEKESTGTPVSFTSEYTIQYAVPENFVLLEESTETVQVTLQGPESIVEKVNPFLVRVKVEIAENEEEIQRFDLSEQNVSLPDGLTVIGFEPSAVTVRLDRILTGVKGVIATPSGEPSAGARVKEILTNPQLVNVRGPASVLQRYDSVFTQTVDLTGHAIDFQERSFIVLPDDSLSLPDGNPTVIVSVKLEIPGSEEATDSDGDETGGEAGRETGQETTEAPSR